jgi:hypothetical protein
VTALFQYTCEEIFLPKSKETGLYALIAGLMFASHPIHSEAISGLVGRCELLAGFGFLVSASIPVVLVSPPALN